MNSKKSNPFLKSKWLKSGLIWGAVMFIIMTFVYPYIDNQEVNWIKVFVGFIVWTLAGIGFGYSMHRANRNKR